MLQIMCGKKHKIGTTQDTEEADLSDANNNCVANDNETNGRLKNNSEVEEM